MKSDNTEQIEESLIRNSELKPRDRVQYNPDVSITSKSEYETLQEISQLNWINRIFRKLTTGSLRGVVIMWIRMTLGVGMLSLPKFVKTYGAITGLCIIILAGIINYFTYVFIFKASYYTGQITFPGLIKKLLGNKMF